MLELGLSFCSATISDTWICEFSLSSSKYLVVTCTMLVPGVFSCKLKG